METQQTVVTVQAQTLQHQERELAPHYYRENFHRLLDTVEAQYGDLLTLGELDFLERYRALGFDAQCL